jgi:DNA-directed RNA polymerase specialized sigma24 family protein
MRTGWTCRGCQPADQERLERCWQAQQAELKTRLPRAMGAPAECQVAVDGGDPAGWQVRAALFLPQRTVVAQVSHTDAEAALEQVAANLGRALKVSDNGAPDAMPNRQIFEVLVPLLERFAATGNAAAFLAFVRPLMKLLAGYARRELRILVRERTLPAAQVTPTDVLDETLVRAWERFQRRPREMPLDLWLIQLIDQNLDELTRGAVHESMERRMPVPTEEPHSSWDDNWIARPGEPETVGFSELLPGRPGIEVWDRLDGEMRQAALAEFLGELSRAQRQALIFHAVEGYDPAEIADFQDRPVDDVLEDIAAARQILWHRTEVEDGLSDVEQRFSQAEDRSARRRRK